MSWVTGDLAVHRRTLQLWLDFTVQSVIQTRRLALLQRQHLPASKCMLLEDDTKNYTSFSNTYTCCRVLFCMLAFLFMNSMNTNKGA